MTVRAGVCGLWELIMGTCVETAPAKRFKMPKFLSEYGNLFQHLL